MTNKAKRKIDKRTIEKRRLKRVASQKLASDVARAKRVKPRLELFFKLLPWLSTAMSNSDVARAATQKGWKTPGGCRTWDAKTAHRFREEFAPVIFWLNHIDHDYSGSIDSKLHYAKYVQPIVDGMKHNDLRERLSLPPAEFAERVSSEELRELWDIEYQRSVEPNSERLLEDMKTTKRRRAARKGYAAFALKQKQPETPI